MPNGTWLEGEWEKGKLEGKAMYHDMNGEV